ncbi:hypothetical protein HF1_06040 [Mycoplasma haemofelis str. Langford 1]|uniref:Uncharacterized protein n=1 Tax=Mycoplasma haemofelis (strain Langford 1) TaxID=941640 RepID=E8ZHJ1_MYCHL|nr:hypothetical protein [Mycoplasma haemofelis]CBY92612.1 hypothetical protein HF1_06040 [Mycoplasma haemofelis str. Langford 1]
MFKADSKLRYLWITSSVVVSVSAGAGAWVISSPEDKREWVGEMKEILDREARLEEEYMRNSSYPSGATQEDIENIDKVTEFERSNGFCHIYFIHREVNGSHYRVNDAFWINESKSQGNRAFLSEFVTIVGLQDLADACRRVGSSGKLLVKNRGDGKWIYVPRDQSKEVFGRWANLQPQRT